MKITAIDIFPVREPRSGRTYTLLKLGSDQGVSGWGEAVSISPQALARARTVVVGQEETRYDYLTRQFAGDPISAALNMALLDLCGKATKAPVFQVLGGPTRSKVRAMTALSNIASSQALLSQGHRAFMVPAALPQRITSRPQIVSGIVAQFTGLRKSLGEGVDFAVDGQRKLPALEATDVAMAIETLHPLWFEQPCREPNTEVLSRIANETATPIGLGEDLTEIGPVQNYLRDGIVDVVRLPVAKLGITPIRRAAAIAETYYVAVAPAHASGGPIATAAALHLAASLPNFFIQQIPAVLDAEERKLRDELVGGAIESVRDGYLSLTTKPGLGIEINEAVLRRMAQ